jgi:hypothetical protein
MKLYKRKVRFMFSRSLTPSDLIGRNMKANMHHYTQYIEPGDFVHGLADIDGLISEYESLGNQAPVNAEDMEVYRRRFNPITK